MAEQTYIKILDPVNFSRMQREVVCMHMGCMHMGVVCMHVCKLYVCMHIE